MVHACADMAGAGIVATDQCSAGACADMRAQCVGGAVDLVCRVVCGCAGVCGVCAHTHMRERERER